MRFLQRSPGFIGCRVCVFHARLNVAEQKWKTINSVRPHDEEYRPGGKPSPPPHGRVSEFMRRVMTPGGPITRVLEETDPWVPAPVGSYPCSWQAQSHALTKAGCEQSRFQGLLDWRGRGADRDIPIHVSALRARLAALGVSATVLDGSAAIGGGFGLRE